MYIYISWIFFDLLDLGAGKGLGRDDNNLHLGISAQFLSLTNSIW